jgi:Plant transposon protein
VYCTHLLWKQCPVELKGQNKNPHCSKLASISSEGNTDHYLHCWHWISGRCGTNNDLQVAANSPFFIDIFTGKRDIKLPGGYEVNGVRRDWPMYLLADGMYPSWATFCGSNHSPISLKEKCFSKRQEATRKDVERLFGCLQGRFKILRREWFQWDINFVVQVSEACVILHNMLVEFRRDEKLDDEFDVNGNCIHDECYSRVYGASSRGP